MGTTATQLRFCSFNIRHGRAPDGLHSWCFRRSSLARTMAAIGADVFGLQEASDPQLDYLLGRLPGYEAVGDGRRRDLGGERCSVLFRSDRLTLDDHRTLWFADDPMRPGAKLPRAAHPRIVTIVRLRAGDLTFEVANTHLDHRHEDNRRRSVELLVSWLEPPMPRVVMGDFNAAPGPVLQPLLDAGYRLVHGRDAGPTFHAFGRRRDGPQIDHILASAHWTVTDASIWRDTPGWRLPSDHWPVVADLGTGPSAGRKQLDR
jgi:endonuclease/exonuclease/phosphatase family metal-dependent hydrolase